MAPGQPVIDDLRRCSGESGPAFARLRCGKHESAGWWSCSPVCRIPLRFGEVRASGAVHRAALEWSGLLDFRPGAANSSFNGTRASRPRGLLRQPASDWRYCGRSPRLPPFVPTPTGKRRISCLYGAPDCQIKWVVFLTGIGTIIECKPLMPS